MSIQNDNQARIHDIAVHRRTMAQTTEKNLAAFRVAAEGSTSFTLIGTSADTIKVWDTEGEAPVFGNDLPADGYYGVAVTVLETSPNETFALGAIVDQNTGESVKDLPMVPVSHLMQQSIMAANALLANLGMPPMTELSKEQSRDPGVIRCMMEGAAIILEDIYGDTISADREFFGKLVENIASVAIKPDITIDVVLSYLNETHQGQSWEESTELKTTAPAFVGTVYRPK